MDFVAVSSWLSLLFLVTASFGCLYALLAAILAERFARQPTHGLPPGAARPSVTILKPLCGGEPDLYENLASFCRQDYAGPVQIVFGVQRPGDPAIETVRRLEEAFPGLRIDLIVDARQHGTNRKVSNLINMAGAIAGDTVVIADSDIVAPSDHLERITAALMQPGIAGVTCLYHGVPADRGIWARLSGLAIDLHFLPNVIVGTALGLARPCFGSTIACRRQTLDAIGGFHGFKDDLADDYALGAALRASGGRVVIPNITIGHACTDTDLPDLWRHELRWHRTIRAIDPPGYAGSIVTHAFPLALIGVAFSGGAPEALAVLALALACRLFLCLRLERAFGLAPHALWLVPIRDLLSFLGFAVSFLSGAVTWKGHDYRVVADGTLVPEQAIVPETGARPA